MTENSSLSKFPSNVVDALAFLYVEKQDLRGKRPEELYDMYKEAQKRINEYKRKRSI